MPTAPITMPDNWRLLGLPGLNSENCRITSMDSARYNCIAWAAGDSSRWWWPDALRSYYWPSDAPREETIEAFVSAYATLGYAECSDASLEAGFQKVALFAKNSGGEVLKPTHAALQLPSGHWTSKLGALEDVDHSDLMALQGPAYGITVRYLKRTSQR
jgi:hypothetical protein